MSDNSVTTGQLVDKPTCGLPTHGLVSLQVGQVADWTADSSTQLLCFVGILQNADY